MKFMCARILLLGSLWAVPATAQAEDVPQARALMLEGLAIHAPQSRVIPSLPTRSEDAPPRPSSPDGLNRPGLDGAKLRDQAAAHAVELAQAHAAALRALELNVILPSVAAAVNDAAAQAAQSAAAQLRTDAVRTPAAGAPPVEGGPVEPPIPPGPRP